MASSPLISLAKAAGQYPKSHFEGDAVFERIAALAKQNHWDRLPMGELVGTVGKELLGTPYVGHTLDIDDNAEICIINLGGLDCVTFFECSLDFARIIKKHKINKEAFMDEVRFTRYRGGKQGDFSSRLHYTSDWIWDNVRKGVVEDITPSLPGATTFTQKVGIMTASPASYRQMNANSGFIPKIKEFEDKINARTMSYVPLAKVADAEHLIQTGDIIGITTTRAGVDITHTGLCYRTDDGVLHFMDASSKESAMKVTLEVGRLNESIRWSRRNTGIMIARPLEPRR